MKNQVKVGGLIYQIKEVDGLADFGSTNFEKQIILINKELTQDNKASTLCHEILEILNHQNDLDLKHQTIQTLEAGLFQIYQDNFTS